MKKILCGAIILLIFAISFSGCVKNNAGVVLPPSRIGTDGTTSTLLEECYTFETAYSASGTVYI